MHCSFQFVSLLFFMEFFFYQLCVCALVKLCVRFHFTRPSNRFLCFSTHIFAYVYIVELCKCNRIEYDGNSTRFFYAKSSHITIYVVLLRARTLILILARSLSRIQKRQINTLLGRSWSEAKKQRLHFAVRIHMTNSLAI